LRRVFNVLKLVESMKVKQGKSRSCHN
jgi:hypothetical protein